MWKVLYIATTDAQCQKIRTLLEQNGFLVQVKSAGGKHNKAYEICVPVSEAEDAYEVLCENKFQC
ncbi:hypothetical protein [Phascolarctobacterium sp.]|uniref:hypothetical protein n=1 Tax=Phascolarctobacterium sp. TaxID=2049039 RepID=UPI00386507C6